MKETLSKSQAKQLTKKERAIARIQASVDFKGYEKKERCACGAEDIYDAAQTYVKALREGRMICVIHSVSNSGMSRTMSFHSTERTGKCNYYVRQYWSLFRATGHTQARGNRDAFDVAGCGMDMVFATNYSLMCQFADWGIITSKQCAELQQARITTL